MDLDATRTELRRRIDEITVLGERSATQSDNTETASGRFSDTELNLKLEDAAYFVVARVQATYLDELVESVNPRSSGLSFMRVLRNTATLNGNIASRKTFKGYRQMEALGEMSDTYPVWVYEDAEFVFRGSTEASGTAAIDVVQPPANGVVDLDERFQEAVIEHAAAMCMITLARFEDAAGSYGRALQALSAYLRPRVRLDQVQEEG